MTPFALVCEDFLAYLRQICLLHFFALVFRDSLGEVPNALVFADEVYVVALADSYANQADRIARPERF